MKEGAKMSIWLEPATKEEIQRLAGRIGITPSKFCRNLVVVGLQETQTMEKLGILQAAMWLDELHHRIRDRIESEEGRVARMVKQLG